MSELRRAFAGGKARTYDAFRATRELLSPKQYLALTGEQRRNIKSTYIRCATLGDNGFGLIEVEYENGTFVVK